MKLLTTTSMDNKVSRPLLLSPSNVFFGHLSTTGQMPLIYINFGEKSDISTSGITITRQLTPTQSRWKKNDGFGVNRSFKTQLVDTYLLAYP